MLIMRKRTEPSYVSDYRLRIARGRKRIKCQRLRVERMRREGRDATRPEGLLQNFVRRQAFREQRLQTALRMLKRNPRRDQSRYLGCGGALRPSTAAPQAGKSAQWNAAVLAFLDRQYAESPNYKTSLINLWQSHLRLGLVNAHFVSELTSGKKSVAFQRAWEMMLARHLDAQGHHLTTSDEGPDFRFAYCGLTIWVEAVSPEPMGVPDHWMEPPKPGEFKVGDVPHTEVLLRWTAAIRTKWDKLQSYRRKKIVRENDAYVIAINGCQLGAFALQHGVSRYPYAVEAVYALGPVTVPIDRTTGKFGQPFVSTRPAIQTAKGAPVATSLFINTTVS
jgi:type I restriction enzyme S subunit